MYNTRAVPPSRIKQTAFRIDPELLDGLQFIKQRDGMPLSVQVRRALAAWLAAKGVKVKAAPRRADTRRRA